MNISLGCYKIYASFSREEKYFCETSIMYISYTGVKRLYWLYILTHIHIYIYDMINSSLWVYNVSIKCLLNDSLILQPSPPVISSPCLQHDGCIVAYTVKYQIFSLAEILEKLMHWLCYLWTCDLISNTLGTIRSSGNRKIDKFGVRTNVSWMLMVLCSRQPVICWALQHSCGTTCCCLLLGEQMKTCLMKSESFQLIFVIFVQKVFSWLHGLECVSCVVVHGGSEAHGLHRKYLHLCSED